MSIDIFGRQSKNKNLIQSVRGPPGDGFKRTSDGHYDINNKRLCNVADPLESNDATSVKITKTIIKEETRILYQLNKSLRDDVDNNNIIANSLQSQFQEFIKNYRLEFETTQSLSLQNIESIQTLESRLTSLNRAIENFKLNFEKSLNTLSTEIGNLEIKIIKKLTILDNRIRILENRSNGS